MHGINREGTSLSPTELCTLSISSQELQNKDWKISLVLSSFISSPYFGVLSLKLRVFLNLAFCQFCLTPTGTGGFHEKTYSPKTSLHLFLVRILEF